MAQLLVFLCHIKMQSTCDQTVQQTDQPASVTAKQKVIPVEPQLLPPTPPKNKEKPKEEKHFVSQEMMNVKTQSGFRFSRLPGGCIHARVGNSELNLLR